jgi:NAD(P)-dependent dehydrogenase (short-subunit alcohol dehydrogenase family)
MWTAADIPDQHQRVAVVTGANGGLGLEVARVLARNGATVVIAARDQDKAHSAMQEIIADIPDAALRLYELDLASLDSVRACAAAVLADHSRIDLLVNNAGIMGIPKQTTADGFEMQVGVNHLGHFVLTHRLLPALLAGRESRVVSVTSFGRFIGRSIRPQDRPMPKLYEPWTAYGRAKLANLQFAMELQRRLEAAGAGVRSVAAHPGLAHTDLQKRSVRETGGGVTQRFWAAAASRTGMAPDRGALVLLRAATDPAARGGELYGPQWFTVGSPVRRPAFGRPGRAGQKLWTYSERMTGERFDVAAAVRGSS